MNLEFDIKHLADPSVYDALVANLAGPHLEALERTRAEARRALEAALPPEARGLLLTWSDAAVDATCAREEAAARVGLALGVGVGAALAAHPDEDPAPLATTAADVVISVMAGPLPAPLAVDVARLVMDTLDRARRATRA